MGKKYRNIYNKIVTFQNLWQASRKARRGKRDKNEVLEFEYNLEENLFDIQEKLINESYQFGDYIHFTITEPKRREISAAPYKDRVVHHAICNIIEPILDRAMIYHSYACRINKGMHKAQDIAQKYIRHNKWVLKLDIRKYFFTIDHQILLDNIKKKISDKKVLNIIGKVLETYQSPDKYYFPFDDDSSKEIHRNRGLPIGNLTSQLFANYYLTSMDRFIKDELKIKHYLRYMDDCLCFADTKEQIFEYRQAIQNYLKTLRLKIHPDKTQIFPAKNGVKFLGFTIFPDHRRIRRENLKRFKKKFNRRINEYENEEIAFENLLMSLNGWLGFANENRHRKLINKILDNLPIQHQKKGYEFTFCV